LVVSVTVADHHPYLLVALLTPMGARDHTAFHRLNHQRALGTIAHIDPQPGLIRQRLTPCRDAGPGTLGPTPPAALLWGLDLQSTHRRVRRHRQHLPLPPRPPADAATKRGVPSRRHRQSNDAADRRRVLPTTPRPTGDACGSLCSLAAHPLCRDGPCPWSMLWASPAVYPPGCGPYARRIPSISPLGSCPLCP